VARGTQKSDITSPLSERLGGYKKKKGYRFQGITIGGPPLKNPERILHSKGEDAGIDRKFCYGSLPRPAQKNRAEGRAIEKARRNGKSVKR